MSFTRKRKIAPLIVILVFVFGMIIGTGMVRYSQAANETYDNLKTFSEVLSIIQKNYVEEVKPKELIYGAIKGMVADLDPHSSFMTPEEYKEMQVDTKGEFGGLGIQIGVKDRTLTVIAPIEDTPAFKAGIKAGDKIIKIDGAPTNEMTLTEAVDKMRGPKGSPVTITVMREDFAKPRDFTIVRDVITIKSVKSKIIDNEIGYIHLSQFQEKTDADLEKALKEFDDKNVKSIILDLRNDPGGLLNMAVDVSGEFLPTGKLVVYIKGRNGEKDEFFTNQSSPRVTVPMVVLVNGGSASASEIVAGCLQDWGRAVIMGTTTFGKGSVQTVIGLSDGSGLRLTTAKYYTPKDRSIQNTGIKPDIEVKQPQLASEKKRDTDFTHGLREIDLENHLGNDTLKNKDLELDKKQKGDISVGGPTPKEPKIDQTPESPGEPVQLKDEDDYQLQRAEDLLKGLAILDKMPKKK
ncbi:MAG: S41 family peptidase [Nitrospirota bacterium]